MPLQCDLSGHRRASSPYLSRRRSRPARTGLGASLLRSAARRSGRAPCGKSAAVGVTSPGRSGWVLGVRCGGRRLCLSLVPRRSRRWSKTASRRHRGRKRSGRWAPRSARSCAGCRSNGRLWSSPSPKVPVPVPRSGLASLLRFLFGPPRLHPQLQGEQELALAMAQCALDDNQKVHMRILQTVYKRLTSSSLGCPRYGAHWEELGFQGVDPGTDLRGTGMLGLMQILFFVMDSQMLPLAREIFRLSQQETQSFPFCIMSVNITHMVLQALRQERLCRECNRRGQVIAVLNQLYAAAFLRLYHLWKGQNKTLADSNALLKELEIATRKKPKQLLKSLETYLKQSPTAEILQQLCPQAGTGEDIDFLGICDPQVELEGAARLI
ncbi:ELMO domain-containing protein 3 isoform X5 [Pogoniulus pusillus]|uniref:ELMO domain-containing protein 3 isoform X5 n=1 Tax=Pogoniulus pusillus TaxID=488313 RepID=UPI0030B99E70